MLTYTPESKKMIFDLLDEAGRWGTYSKEFVTELHRRLSILHLREEEITITYVEFKSEPVHAEKMVKFTCEISLKWTRGMVGGLVWHEHDGTFGIHT